VGGEAILEDKNGNVLSFDTLEEAVNALPHPTGFNGVDWAHVLDLLSGSPWNAVAIELVTRYWRQKNLPVWCGFFCGELIYSSFSCESTMDRSSVAI